MGLGLSIVKSITDSLHGHISIHSNPEKSPGTEIIIVLERHISSVKEHEVAFEVNGKPGYGFEHYSLQEPLYDENKQTIILVEDNLELLNYLIEKLVLFQRNK